MLHKHTKYHFILIIYHKKKMIKNNDKYCDKNY